MFKIRLAGLVVQVNDRFELFREKCAGYICPDGEETQITIGATDANLDFAKRWFLEKDGVTVSDGYAEFDVTPYQIYPRLADYGAFWLHSCLLEIDGKGYAFTAPPETGKTTHARRYMEEFPGRVRVIDGDGPILREEDGVFRGYGTPFCGKEGWNENRSVPMAGVCFLERAEENRIERMKPLEAALRLFRENWCVPWGDLAAEEKNWDLYVRFVEKVPVYRMHLNNFSPGAARVSYEGMVRDL